MKVNATPDHPTQTINVGRKLKNSKGDLDPIAPRPPVIDTSLKDMIRDGDELYSKGKPLSKVTVTPLMDA